MQDSSRKGFQWKESRSVTFVLVAYPSWVSGYPGIRVSIPSIIYSITFTLPWFNRFLEAICLLSDTLPLGLASQNLRLGDSFSAIFVEKPSQMYLVLQKSNAEETACQTAVKRCQGSRVASRWSGDASRAMMPRDFWFQQTPTENVKPFLNRFQRFQRFREIAWGHSCLASPASFGNLAAPKGVAVLVQECDRHPSHPQSLFPSCHKTTWEGICEKYSKDLSIFVTPQLQPHVFGALTLNLALYDIVVVLHSSEMTQASEERNIREHKGTCEPREPIWIWVVSLS